jgi:HD-like signal output (HDOD) protein
MKRILFVDDESRVLDGLRRILYEERKHWDMQFAAGGEEALQACEAGRFDVVVTDMRMPGMNGIALLSQLRDRYPSTARIVLSGYSEAGLATQVVSLAHRFLVKPCSSAEIRSTIERVCSLQDVLGTTEIRRVVGAVGELPSLSNTYTSLTRAVGDPNATIERVAAIIEKDVAMTAKVLQLANSAFFGLGQKVTTLENATTYLGMETLKNLAFVSEAFRVFVPDRRIPQSVCTSMQRHAQHTAAIAGLLPVGEKARDEAVVSALLHDIGKLFLASAMPEEFCLSLARANERKCKPYQAEEELLGTSHAEIGAYLLGLWGLPDLVVDAIAHHHRPLRIPHTEFDSGMVVFVADLLAHEEDSHLRGSTEATIDEFDRACLEELGLLSRLTEFREVARQRLQ